MFFFFQAEDGIRDLVRSRGLGDVYKRQLITGAFVGRVTFKSYMFFLVVWQIFVYYPFVHMSVSYTHLTLPTSDLV